MPLFPPPICLLSPPPSPSSSPTSNGGMQNGSSVGICTRCTNVFFARLGADLHAQSVIIKKIFASELCRKFIKSVLLVGFSSSSSSSASSSSSVSVGGRCYFIPPQSTTAGLKRREREREREREEDVKKGVTERWAE